MKFNLKKTLVIILLIIVPVVIYFIWFRKNIEIINMLEHFNNLYGIISVFISLVVLDSVDEIRNKITNEKNVEFIIINLLEELEEDYPLFNTNLTEIRDCISGIIMNQNQGNLKDVTVLINQFQTLANDTHKYLNKHQKLLKDIINRNQLDDKPLKKVLDLLVNMQYNKIKLNEYIELNGYLEDIQKIVMVSYKEIRERKSINNE